MILRIMTTRISQLRNFFVKVCNEKVFLQSCTSPSSFCAFFSYIYSIYFTVDNIKYHRQINAYCGSLCQGLILIFRMCRKKKYIIFRLLLTRKFIDENQLNHNLSFSNYKLHIKFHMFVLFFFTFAPKIIAKKYIRLLK